MIRYYKKKQKYEDCDIHMPLSIVDLHIVENKKQDQTRHET